MQYKTTRVRESKAPSCWEHRQMDVNMRAVVTQGMEREGTGGLPYTGRQEAPAVSPAGRSESKQGATLGVGSARDIEKGGG